MKKNIFLTLCYLATILSAVGQLPEMKMGEAFPTSVLSTGFEIIYADDSGFYIKDAYNHEKMLGFGSIVAKVSLIKLDKDMRRLYTANYDSVLKFKNFLRFFFSKTEAFLLATHDNKSDKSREVLAIRLSKETGKLLGDWQTIANLTCERKDDIINNVITYTADSSSIAAISFVQGKENTICQINKFDESLQPISVPFLLGNGFDNKLKRVIEILYTREKNFLVVALNYDYLEGKKKKNDNLFCTGYSTLLYNDKGELISEGLIKLNSKWLVNCKTTVMPNDMLMLASFMGNKKEPNEISSLEIKKLSLKNGNVISDNAYDLGEWLERLKQTNNIKKTPSLPISYMVRKCIPSGDSGFVVLAEEFEHKQSRAIGQGYIESTEISYGNIMTVKLGKDGKISWLNLLSKKQYFYGEQEDNHKFKYRDGYRDGHGYFDSDYEKPFFSGVGSIMDKEHLFLLFNDWKKNKEVTGFKSNVEEIYRNSQYEKTSLFTVAINLKNGECIRKLYKENGEKQISMPRFIYPHNGKWYLIYQQERLFARENARIAEFTLRTLY
jgi:hypothetical protein